MPLRATENEGSKESPATGPRPPYRAAPARRPDADRARVSHVWWRCGEWPGRTQLPAWFAPRSDRADCRRWTFPPWREKPADWPAVASLREWAQTAQGSDKAGRG